MNLHARQNRVEDLMLGKNYFQKFLIGVPSVPVSEGCTTGVHRVHFGEASEEPLSFLSPAK